MSEATINSLISASSGLLGVLIGAILSYLLQMKIDKKRRDYEESEKTKKMLLEGYREFAQQMREQHGAELMSLRQSENLFNTIMITSYIIMLVCILIGILALFPEFRNFLESLFWKHSIVIFLFTSLVGFALGTITTLILTLQRKSK